MKIRLLFAALFVSLLSFGQKVKKDTVSTYYQISYRSKETKNIYHRGVYSIKGWEIFEYRIVPSHTDENGFVIDEYEDKVSVAKTYINFCRFPKNVLIWKQVENPANKPKPRTVTKRKIGRWR